MAEKEEDVTQEVGVGCGDVCPPAGLIGATGGLHAMDAVDTLNRCMCATDGRVGADFG